MREGFHKAIVTNNRDPESKGRVRLRVPHILGPAETGWASPMFATDVPKVGDQVYATFESGDEDRILFTPENVGIQGTDGLIIQDILSSSTLLPEGAPDGHAYLIEGNLWARIEGTWVNLGNIAGGSDAVFFGVTPPENTGLLWVDESEPGPNLGAFVPVGGIIDFYGDPVGLPDNWKLCDGTNGTPNLQDRFVVGAGGQYALGATGGADQVTLTTSQMPSHNHAGPSHTHIGPSHTHGSGRLSTGSAGSHAHALGKSVIDTAKSHNHSRPNSGGSIMAGSTNEDSALTTSNGVNSAGAHTHTVSGSTSGAGTGNTGASGTGNTGTTGGGGSHENRPPYFGLYKIMRIA